MNIARLKVRIGDREEELKDCSDDDPAIAELIGMAMASSAVIAIEVPQTSEAASLLDRLVHGKPEDARVKDAGSVDLIPVLSRPLVKCELSIRAKAALYSASVFFVWQLAEMSYDALRTTKNVGPRTLEECQKLLAKFGLTNGMNLDSLKEQLPKRPDS